MILFPPAKINLGLKVLGKRPDGFHEIETCMYSIDWTDVLELIEQIDFQFVQSGITVDCDQEDNLCVKAFRLMQEAFNVPNVHMHLRKNIPMGAGLGGGSADAAYVIRGINELFKLDLGNPKMIQLAAQLGSDCAFFIEDQPQIANGRGEVLSAIDLDLTLHHIKLVNPGIHVGTKEAYAGVKFSGELIPLRGLLRQPIEMWKHTLENDFESSVIETHPIIGEIKDQLYSEGAIYASMTGSGSTIFGIYAEKPEKSFSEYLEWIS
jgi:4-diphosphocytidyl-2-C-methyl-D-erythritol kinase